MKNGLRNKAVHVLLAAVMILAGCSKVNVPNEELRKAMPKDPAKEIGEASIKFITFNYKLYAAITELDKAFRLEGGATDPDTVGEILEYAESFAKDTEDALDGISDWSRNNGEKLGELIQKAADLKRHEKGALIHFRALSDSDFQEKQRAYVAGIREYLKAAGKVHGFLQENYANIVLGLDGAPEKYHEQLIGLSKVRDALNVQLAEVSTLFGVLLKSKAELMGLTQDDAQDKDKAGKGK